jgi:hypothetical protein
MKQNNIDIRTQLIAKVLGIDTDNNLYSKLKQQVESEQESELEQDYESDFESESEGE